MRFNEFKENYEKLKSEEKRQQLAHDYAEEKIVWCGRIMIFIFLLLIIWVIFIWLLCALKHLLIALF